MFLSSGHTQYPIPRTSADMLTMTTAETPTFSNPFTRPGLHLVDQDVSCFIMKASDPWEQVRSCIGGYGRELTSSKSEDEMADLLERIEMIELDYDDDIKTDCPWGESSKRASRHLSGGGLLEKPEPRVPMQSISGTVSNCSGSVVSTPQIQDGSPSPEVVPRVENNPFRNHLRLELNDNSGPQTDLPKNGCVFSATNPFSVFNNSSPDKECETSKLKRTPSQCSTRVASPTKERIRPDSFIQPGSKHNEKRKIGRTVSRCSEHVPRSEVNDPFNCVPPSSFELSPKLVNQSTQTSAEPPWLFHDRKCLQTTMAALRMSGWYYESISWQDSLILLDNTEPGTFLIRDSADPNFLFSLSVQTSRGPTSVRLHFINGRFRLNADEKVMTKIPSFPSVMELIEFYIAHSESRQRRRQKSKRKDSTSTKEKVWVDAQGQIFSDILISKPLRRSDRVNSLKHLCRLAVCRNLRRQFSSCAKSKSLIVPDQTVPMTPLIDSLCIPQDLNTYLKEYPYSQ